MIRKISINNYKMFSNFNLDLHGGVSLICGSNGSGKSALRELVSSLVSFLAIPDASDHVSHSVDECFPFEVFCRWSSRKTGYDDIVIGLELGDGNEWFEYSLTVRYNFRDNESRVQTETLNLCTSNGTDRILTFSTGSIKMMTDDHRPLEFSGDWRISGLIIGSRNNSKIRDFGVLMSRIYAVHFDPSAIAEDIKIGSQTLDSRGELFSSWHFYNMTNHSERQHLVTEQCKNFIPGFVSINSPQSGDVYRLKIRVKYNGAFYDLELRELSDGQKILFALYSLLANAKNGSTIIIDEPENYLAPSELQPWLDAIHDAWEDRDIQFVIITHNPKTMNWYHKDALIFKIVGEPPRIAIEYNSNETSMALFDKLSELEWTENGTESR